MKLSSCIGEKLKHFHSCSCLAISHMCKSTWFLVIYYYRYILVHGNQFSFQLLYFLFISTLGFLILNSTHPRTTTFSPSNLDLFFTSVSAATISSMSTVEMEVFSDTQLVVLMILMFLGGKVFTSMVGLHLHRSSLKRSIKEDSKVNSSTSDLHIPSNFFDQIELGIATRQGFESSKSDILDFGPESLVDMEDLKYKSAGFLGQLVLVYLISVQFLGMILVLIYINVTTSAKNILQEKGLKTLTFSLFTAASTFSNCGFIPTNESMMVFKQNSGLLLILIPQILLGNALYPAFLRLSIWVTGKFTKKAEASYLLTNSDAIGYHHLLSGMHSSFLVATVLVFMLFQFLLFSSMEWDSGSLGGMDPYQKFVGVLFQTVNTRHTGETVVDLSTTTAAVLVLMVVMMYLPAYTSFLPPEKNCEQEKSVERKKGNKVMDKFIFSQLTYLAIFIIIVCITEMKNIQDDPLNFNALTIVFEVTSAYGNVGFTTGYSCDRRLKPDGGCENKWYGFSGKWSNEGKLVLIVVMIFGRLKKFNLNGGKSWKLL